MPPTTEEELQLVTCGYRRVAGIDEVGRGCWAGPVVAAAVILPEAILRDPSPLAGVDDSKQLTATERAVLAKRITAHATDWALGSVPAHLVDSHGIVAATRLAMQVALLQLACPPDALLIDAVRLEDWPCPQSALISGDARCLSIAAASILAKVARDSRMAALGLAHPQYGFEQHKGYGTALHARALHSYGPCSQHRRSFRPVAAVLELLHLKHQNSEYRTTELFGQGRAGEGRALPETPP
jgi:ribonuclease HII